MKLTEVYFTDSSKLIDNYPEVLNFNRSLLKLNQSKSEMTLTYRRRVERHPKPNGVVTNSIPNHENFSLLDKNVAT